MNECCISHILHAVLWLAVFAYDFYFWMDQQDHFNQLGLCRCTLSISLTAGFGIIMIGISESTGVLVYTIVGLFLLSSMCIPAKARSTSSKNFCVAASAHSRFWHEAVQIDVRFHVGFLARSGIRDVYCSGSPLAFT